MATTPALSLPDTLSDDELLNATMQAAIVERHATVRLLALLAEVDVRRLYFGQGCSSLFGYCTQRLRFSEHAAYHRMEAARAVRRHPVILDILGEGALTLTTIALLRPHLTDENHVQLLTAARHKSNREVEYQVACLAPKPDAKPLVRRLPARVSPAAVPVPLQGAGDLTLEPVATAGASKAAAMFESTPLSSLRERTVAPMVKPLAEDRYLLRVTISAATHQKLERARDLMRHTIPDGDQAAILDRALDLLVTQLERTKTGHARRPRQQMSREPRKDSRHIPAAVKREVWARDGGRCAFEGPHGRCVETGRLEFHHVVPFATGGPTIASNLALRCRAHNAYEGEQRFGRFRETRSGPSADDGSASPGNRSSEVSPPAAR